MNRYDDPRTDPALRRPPHDLADLGALALGLIDAGAAREAEAHLAGCAGCRAELDALRATADALAGVPPETFVEGPPGSDLALRRALRRVDAEAGAARRRRRFARVAGAAAAVVALAGGGVLVGRVTAPPPAVVATPAGTVTVAGTAVGTDGAEIALSATLTPARGWVRVSATVRGIPPDERCSIVVLGEDGTENVAGSWLTSPRGRTEGTSVDGAAIVDPAAVYAVTVRDDSGTDLITVPV